MYVHVVTIIKEETINLAGRGEDIRELERGGGHGGNNVHTVFIQGSKKPLKFKTCELLNGLLYVEPNSLNSAFTFFLASCFAA